MKHLSTSVIVLFIGSLCSTGSPAAKSPKWPINGTIDLSSGFGDYRVGHFHGGVDIRTGGVEGWAVISPVDGYVWRVKMSYTGYGKGLYVKGDDGHIYVFGHLSRLADKIRNPVRFAQRRDHKYGVDLYFPADSIPVKAGEIIAHSGQSGLGAPHLHFEKRAPDNVPLDPLGHGFELPDKIAPTFTRVSFQMTDDTSLFDDGTRQLFHEVASSSPGNFHLDTLFYFNRPFGMLIDGFDQMRTGGMQQSINKLSVAVDDKELYRSVFDSIEFESGSLVGLEFDYQEVVNDRPRVRRLFFADGEKYAGIDVPSEGNGVWGNPGKEKIGRHTATITGEDSFGNQSALTFEFLWGPPGPVFTLDSSSRVGTDTTEFFFTACTGWEKLGIDSVEVFLNRGDYWGPVPNQITTLEESGHLKCRVPGRSTNRALMKLVLFASPNGLIQDEPFNGILPGGKPNLEFEYELTDDGILVKLHTVAKSAHNTKVELYYRDSLLGVEYPRLFTMKTHTGLIPPRPQYAHIDRMEVAGTVDSNAVTRRYDSLTIFIVGTEEEETFQVDDQLTLTFGRDRFFKPHFVEVKSNQIMQKALLHIDSKHYEIFPEAFVCRQNFLIDYKFRTDGKFNSHGGICWLDKEKEAWVWLDNIFENNTLEAESTGGGSFATVIDYDPPVLSRLNIYDGKTYRNPRQQIKFIAEDSLSGIRNDDNILVKLDGDWQIVDFDPETGQCVAEPDEPLSDGRHHLAIVLTDRAGNVFEHYLNFYVNSGKSGGN